jgi:predicted RNA-binding Zn ribbon-like protein
MASTKAPGALETMRSFVNTLERSEGKTHPDRLAEWCEQSGLCRSAGGEDLDRLRAFREAVRSALATRAFEPLERFAGEAGYTMRIPSGGRPVLEPSGAGADAAIGKLFAILYDAAGDGTWERLKTCRKHDCRSAFYDRSKNASGTWCDMALCGNRAKAQRRRARQKTARKFA